MESYPVEQENVARRRRRVNEGKPVVRDQVAVEKLRMEVDISERRAKTSKRT